MRYSEKAKERQLMLSNAGFYHGDIDGFFGKKSKQAEREYLISKGSITVDDGRELSLREHRIKFSVDFSKLIAQINNDGYGVAIDDVKSIRRCKIHMVGSQHEKGLAGDLLLYDLDGEYLTKTKDHKVFGNYWESLSEFNRWGGRYGDGNHYERLEYIWR